MNVLRTAVAALSRFPKSTALATIALGAGAVFTITADDGTVPFRCYSGTGCVINGGLAVSNGEITNSGTALSAGELNFAEADSYFVNDAGDTMTGALDLQNTLTLESNWIFDAESEGGTERLRLQGTGVNDAAELFIQSKGSADSARITVTPDSSTANFSALTMESNGTTHRIQSTVDGNETVLPLAFTMTETEVMRIATDNNVGIGTTTPATKLEVQGTISGSTVNATNLTPRAMAAQVTASGTALTAGSGKVMIPIGVELAGYNLISVDACVGTPGITGSTEIQLRNTTDGTHVLSTAAQIETGEQCTYTSAERGTINASNDDVLAGELLELDVPSISTGTAPTGLTVWLRFAKP